MKKGEGMEGIRGESPERGEAPQIQKKMSKGIQEKVQLGLAQLATRYKRISKSSEISINVFKESWVPFFTNGPKYSMKAQVS